MEEFTSYAIWILMVFLSVNAAIIWFADTDTFENDGFVTGLQENNLYDEDYLASQETSFFGISCDAANSNVLLYAPCTILQVLQMGQQLIANLWSLMTAWVTLLNAILTPLPGGELFKNVLIPFIGLIQATSIFLVVLKLAQIARGTA